MYWSLRSKEFFSYLNFLNVPVLFQWQTDLPDYDFSQAKGSFWISSSWMLF